MLLKGQSARKIRPPNLGGRLALRDLSGYTARAWKILGAECESMLQFARGPTGEWALKSVTFTFSVRPPPAHLYKIFMTFMPFLIAIACQAASAK